MAAKAKPKAKGAASANGVPAAPDVLTLAEAAAFLRVPTDGLLADAEAGRVPARRVAGEWRFGRAQLLDWLGGREPEDEAARVARLLSVAGSLADDETLLPMMEEIYRERKRHPVGG
jgi:hypothetical protein